MKPFNLEEYLANKSKKVVTRDGRDVKILCTNYYLGNQYVIAEVVDIDRSFSFNQYGVQYGTTSDSPLDLFFAPEKHEGWINIYRGKDGLIVGNVVFASKEEAEESKRHCCGFTQDLYLKTAKIEWEE